MSALSETTTRDERRSAIESLPACGVWAPALTVLRPDLGLDAERCIAHYRWLLGEGCDGIAFFGTTSEANSFSMEERMALLERVVEAGVAPEQLMVGTGCCAFPETIALSRHALRHGCRKVLMLPPFYYKGVSDDGLFDSYSRIIDGIGDPALRVFLYHFPRMSATPLSVELVGRLADAFPGIIAGVKDSSGDWSNTAALLDAHPQLAIFPGAETFLLDGLRAGGAGCITATANVNPRAVKGVYERWREAADDLDEAQGAVSATRLLFEKHPAIPAMKAVLAEAGGHPAWRLVRPPLRALDEAETAALLTDLEAHGFSLAAR